MKNPLFSILLLLSLLMSTSVMAGPRNRQQAQQIAKSKAQSLGVQLTTATPAYRAGQMTATDEAYYVFNNGNDNGWTIVSGDDRMPEVLGYSDKGTLDLDNLPEALKDILESFENTYADVNANPDLNPDLNLNSNANSNANKSAKAAAIGTTNLAIGPLLTTTWDQYEPYYNLTPTVDGVHCATCCVATAMAQILYYLYHTQAGQSATTFDNDIKSQKGDIAGPRTYEWDKMLSDYTGANYTDEQANAVATLMRDCGYMLNVNYDVETSTAYSEQIKAKGPTYFGLDATSTTYKNYSDVEDFFAAVDAELNTYHPVQVCGSSHAFVCDGRDASGQYYHFNFGYSGGGNGFYCSDAYNGYTSWMALTTGLRLANDPASPTTATDKLEIVYKAAVKTAGLRPVGTVPGMYQQTYYEELMSYLNEAKNVLEDKTAMADDDIIALINNIGIAEQTMTTRTTPYPEDWYYINTATQYNGQYYGLKYYKQGTSYFTALYGGYNQAQKFKFVYDEESNGYYISNFGCTIYLVAMPSFGADPTWTNKVDEKVPCEVIATDRIGDSAQWMVTIRPMAEGYRDDQDRYLCAWTNDDSNSWPAQSTDYPCWVFGADPYYDYSKWTLTSVTSDIVPTATFAESNVDVALATTKAQTVTTESDGQVTYSSNDITIATVDPETGAVTGVGEGTATITAAIGASSEYTAAVATYTVNVYNDPAKIDLTPALSQGEGVVYNVAGQRVTPNAKGVVIKKGKKYMRPLP